MAKTIGDAALQETIDEESLHWAMLTIAQQYGQVMIWADRAEVAKRLAPEICAHAINSPGDKDANVLLSLVYLERLALKNDMPALHGQ